MLPNVARRAIVAPTRPAYVCPSCILRQNRRLPSASSLCPPRPSSRALHTETLSPQQADTPFRKQLKDAVKKQKKGARGGSGSIKDGDIAKDPRLDKWELTVGIEIHAELNTARKLFSGAATSETRENVA